MSNPPTPHSTGKISLDAPPLAAELLAGLQRSAAYPHRPAEIRLVQTHISAVFLADDQVFKVKKPVRFAFLDFSTRERRKHFCEEEVRLNRRLAPDVYRGVVPITRDASGFHVGGPGEPIEWAVHMRRLPEDRFLRALVERGEADASLMQRIAGKMAAFHVSPAADPETSGGNAPEDLARTLAESRNAIATALPEVAAVLPAIERLGAAALARQADRLRARAAAGRIRHCHGDLRPDHVCCTPELPIFDCVEFSAAIRHCDVASEMAFLAMELEFLGAPALARAVIDAYVAASGDRELPAVLPVFLVHRALIRAMVAALTTTEPEVGAATRTRTRADAPRYLALALRSAWAAQAPLVIAIGGQSGSGKSTLAVALAAETGYAWLRSDELRKREAGLAPTARPRSAAERAALYAPERTAAVYAALAAEAAPLLAAGRGVLLDATFQRRHDREQVRARAAASGTPVLWIECRAAPATIRARLERRTHRDDDPSDATWEIAQAQAARFEAFDEVPPATRLVLATDAGGDPTGAARAWLIAQVTSAAG